MKNKFTLPLIMAVFAACYSSAQNALVAADTIKKDTSAEVTLFTARYFEGKTYLHWDVKDQKCDGAYIVCRSFDGKKYESIGFKEGIGVKISAPIAYYFQDEHSCPGTTYYKLVHISKDRTYILSKEIAVYMFYPLKYER